MSVCLAGRGRRNSEIHVMCVHIQGGGKQQGIKKKCRRQWKEANIPCLKQTSRVSPKKIIVNCEKISPMSKKNNRMFLRVFPFFDPNFFSKKILESAHGPHWYPLNTPKTSFEPTKPRWATAIPKPWTPGSTWFFSQKMGCRADASPYMDSGWLRVARCRCVKPLRLPRARGLSTLTFEIEFRLCVCVRGGER